MRKLKLNYDAAFEEVVTDSGESFLVDNNIDTTKNTAKNDGVKMQTRIVDNQSVVWIENNVLSNKELHDYSAIADFIKGNIGKMYTIIESGQKVYLGESLPDEYTQSKYTSYLKNRNKSLLLSKNKAAVAIGEMIEIATNRRWEPAIHNDNKDVKYGIYRYDTKFAFPLKNQNGDTIDVKCFDAELLICNASNGKKYLYDIVNIKKTTLMRLISNKKRLERAVIKPPRKTMSLIILYPTLMQKATVISKNQNVMLFTSKQ